jgi:hypothetical protein
MGDDWAHTQAMTNREGTPISTNQAVRAFRRLDAKDASTIQKAAERIASKTGMKLTEAMQVLASIGVYSIRHDG